MSLRCLRITTPMGSAARSRRLLTRRAAYDRVARSDGSTARAARRGSPPMTHSIEPAKTGRATCRGCNRPIAKDELRFGERVTNVFGDGETTLWFHLRCAAFKRPETFLEAL